MQDAAQSQLEVLGEHTVFRFWRGVSVALQGSFTEAMRDYTSADGKREVSVAVIAGKIHALKSQRQIDQDAIDELETRMMVDEKNATSIAWLQLAAFYWIMGEHVKARDACQRASPDHTDDFLNPLSLLGWINLTSNRSAFVEKSISNFDKAVEAPAGVANHTDALLGKVAYLDLKKNFSAAIHILNSIIAALPANADIVTPVQVEKAKIMIKKGQWDQAADTVQKILKSDPHNVQALMVMNLYLMAEDSKQSTVAVSNLRELYKALETTEPKTHMLFAFTSKTLARLAVTPGLLTHTMSLILKACELQPSNADYMSEKAYQLSLAGEWAKSLEAYKQVLELDDGMARLKHNKHPPTTHGTTHIHRYVIRNYRLIFTTYSTPPPPPPPQVI